MSGREFGDQAAPRRVGPELAGCRLDAVVRALFEVSWGQARRWIESGKVFVGGEAALDAEQTVGEGAEVALRLDAPRPRSARAVDDGMVVHLDRTVLVLAKPPGVSTVPHEEGERGALVDELRHWLARRHPERDRPRGGAGRRREALPPLFVVHRLDRGTSGLLVFARTLQAASLLRDQFKRHEVHRRYLALAHGHVEDRTFRSHLIVNRGDGLRGSRERALRPVHRHHEEKAEKLAVTHVEALERFDRPCVTLLRCRLETGRTHQIRIHLSEAGHPLLGETIYLRRWEGPEVAAPRLMLHAAELGFVHPGSGERLRFEQPLPEDMAAVLERLQRGRS
jgi:23S rRNA pseudouridine1911/1915/1917 synthase